MQADMHEHTRCLSDPNSKSSTNFMKHILTALITVHKAGTPGEPFLAPKKSIL